MNDTELKVIIELLKNSRRSDRELSKAIGVSQPTVSRTIDKLKKQGYIKEFTIIPDFKKLGFQVMSIVLSSVKEKVTPEQIEESRREIRREEKENPNALLFGYTGMGLNSDRASILLNKDYSEYLAFTRHAKEHSLVDVERMQSFIVDLCDESHYLPITLSQVARYLEKRVSSHQGGS
jgi:DNA-binding Lrp family transcriptional regulator